MNNCRHCSILIEKKHRNSYLNVYCSLECQIEGKFQSKIAAWKCGDIFPLKAVKRYLARQKQGCWVCGITEWMGKAITLELEHRDGNSSNNNEENLSLLCPNCHSQTPTYKAKNNGNGRHSRRQRYLDGKSF